MSHTVSQILVAARRNPELIAGETAAYIVLSLAEQSLSGPRRVCAQHVLLHPGGALTIGDVELCSNAENDARLRALLEELLVCSVPATVSESLKLVTERRGDGPAAVRAELQTALVPLNRGAARRALARLHRRLSQVGGDDAAVDCAGINSAGMNGGEGTEEEVAVVRAVPRRAKRRGPALGSEEIPIAVDETAFGVVSRCNDSKVVLVAASTADAATSGASDGVYAHWHPAQTTPWQFRERVVDGGDGTPILGSVVVRERDAFERARPGSTEAPQTAPNTLEERAPETWDRSALTSAPVAAAELQTGLDEWVDTFVDAPVALVGDATEAAPTFSPRRSRVAELVQRIPAHPRGAELLQKSLLDLVNESHDEPEFVGLGTVTPPPVARETSPEPVRASRRGPRRIVLSTLVAGVAGVGAWALLAHPFGEPPAAATAVSTQCTARVHVEVPKSATVFLNDATERAAQNGPLAQFEAVSCRGQAEVTVHVSSPAGSPLPDAWVRMPLPEIELRGAFEKGVPLVVAPLGDPR